MGSPDDAVESCEQCGFDSTEWNDQDTINTIKHGGDLVRQWGAPLSVDHVGARPTADMWSAAEYTDHLRETFFAMRFLVDLARDDPGHDVGPAPEAPPLGPHRTLDFESCLHALDGESRALASSLTALGPDGWASSVVIAGNRRTARWASRHGLHDFWHHLTDITSIVAMSGAGVATQHGVVHQINVSGGGVPKSPIATAHVGRRGIEGDVQRSRVHHGRPWQALCLYSSEVIAELAAEGHPIHAGAVGENVTISGLDWATVHAGALITIGDMVCQVSAPAVPCSKNRRWFLDGRIDRMSHEVHPEATRWYASVLTPGSIRAGDSVKLSLPV